MKALIASMVSLAVIVCAWCVYVNFADDTLHELIDMIDQEVTVQIHSQEWEDAEETWASLTDSWHQYKKVYTFFIDTAAINDTDYSIARTEAYIEQQNPALALGELSCVKEQLTFLHLNELINSENIF